jgi:RsiG-like
MEETFPDIGAMSDRDLKNLIEELTEEEHQVSYRRRLLHGKIDILRAELVNRLRGDERDEGGTISGSDVQNLTDIMLGKVPPEDEGQS